MTSGIVGRDEELASLLAFLAQDPATPSALVLEGEAGIGKSTLWLAGVEAARDRGLQVLTARPAEAERGLAFAGLGDCFEPVLDRILPALATPRRRALEVALLVDEASGSADPRAVGVAVRNALEHLASEAPVVVAVDDVQWLDPSSAAAFSFAFRRLSRPAFVLLTRRVAEDSGRSELELSLAPDRVERLTVGPLSVGALQSLVQGRVKRPLSRPTLLRIHEASGGNPFYALELARALGPQVDPTKPLPVPETLEGLVDARLSGLPKATRAALTLAAVVGSPTLELLRSAGVVEDALAPALASSVIEETQGSIRFTHPLLASVLYRGLSEPERRAMHGSLANIIEDPVERARHLALSASEPDAGIAAALGQAAAIARDRGAVLAAAELGELALRATPSIAADDRRQRVLETARDHLAVGAADRVRALTQELLDGSSPGRTRAEALTILSELSGNEGMANREVELLRSALRQAVGAPELELEIRWRLANAVRVGEGTAASLSQARAALELAERVGDHGLTARALAALAEVMLHAGEAGAIAVAEKSLARARRAGDHEAVQHALWATGCCLTWAGQVAEAREALAEAYASLADRDYVKARLVLWLLALVELRAGRWELAREYAEQRFELSEMLAEGDAKASIPLALVTAHQGEETQARSIAERGVELAEASGNPFFASWHRGVLGLLELWGGRPAGAVELFEAAMSARASLGFREPGSPLYRVDYVEALLELGRIDETLAVLEPWEADAERLGRDWALAQTTRCRGMVAAARGEVEDAQALLEEATVRHEAVGDPFGRARALLALGVTRRRARQKQATRATIERALEGFEALGARQWAEKARAELGRIGGRRREESLTAAERRVAALVAEGRTNREVAAALFVGERTVETHLTHIYAKLGVRSRTELAHTLGSQG